MRAVALAFVCMAAPAFGQDVFPMSDGCSAYLTVQGKSCKVHHYFTCAGDPADHQRRVTLDEEGLTFLSQIDHEAQWISSTHVLGNFSERLAPNPADPASLSGLIASGIDTYDFETMSDQVGRTRFVGQDELTGRMITIDDVTLQETAYQITALDAAGNVLWEAQGNEFISRDWRMFLPGTGLVTTPSDSFEKDDSPVEFIFPGEPGFLSTNPKYDCGIAIS